MRHFCTNKNKLYPLFFSSIKFEIIWSQKPDCFVLGAGGLTPGAVILSLPTLKPEERGKAGAVCNHSRRIGVISIDKAVRGATTSWAEMDAELGGGGSVSLPWCTLLLRIFNSLHKWPKKRQRKRKSLASMYLHFKSILNQNEPFFYYIMNDSLCSCQNLAFLFRWHQVLLFFEPPVVLVWCCS